MSIDDDYVCSLDIASQQRAKEELHEDPNECLSVLHTYRSWINDQKWLRTPKDTLFLLQLLRARKFSQIRARDLIENYWKYRTLRNEWYRGINPADQKLQEIWQQGILLSLPKRDENGRRILLYRVGKIDSSGKKYTVIELTQACIMLLEALLVDEHTQVNGVVVFFDLTGFTIRHQRFFGVEHVKKNLEIVQNASALRVKEVHCYNMSPVFEAFFPLVKPFLKEKLRKRIFMHGHGLMSLYGKINMSLLPTEYLPDDYTGPTGGTIDDIIQSNMDYIRQPHVQSWLEKLHSPEWGYDRLQKPIHDEPQASFRKLAVS